MMININHRRFKVKVIHPDRSSSVSQHTFILVKQSSECHHNVRSERDLGYMQGY